MTADENEQPVVATWTVTFSGTPRAGTCASVAQQAGMTIGTVLDEALDRCSFPGFTSVTLRLERAGETEAA